MQPDLNSPAPRRASARRLSRLLVPVVVAGFIAWFLLGRGKPAPAPATVQPQLSGPRADTVAPGAGATLQNPAAAAAPAAGDNAAVEAATPTGSAGAPLPGQAAAGTADERQERKIVRGLAVDPDGALRVESTPPGSVVGQLHLLPGDVLVSLNGHRVATLEDFARLYREQGAGEFTVLRNGKEVHRR